MIICGRDSNKQRCQVQQNTSAPGSDLSADPVYHAAKIASCLCCERYCNACYVVALDNEACSAPACDHLRLAVDAVIGIACDEWQTAWFCQVQPLVFPRITTRDDATGGTSRSRRRVTLQYPRVRQKPDWSQRKLGHSLQLL